MLWVQSGRGEGRSQGQLSRRWIGAEGGLTAEGYDPSSEFWFERLSMVLGRKALGGTAGGRETSGAA